MDELQTSRAARRASALHGFYTHLSVFAIFALILLVLLLRPRGLLGKAAA